MRVLLSPLPWLSLLLSACASLSGPRAGLDPEGRLQPCPPAPRCVSSQEAGPALLPLHLRDASGATWEAVAALVGGLPRTELVTVQPHYLHAEVTSPWGLYIDDLELLRDAGGRRVQVRSSARIGYYDFGVNRDRVAMLRARLRERGLLAGPD